ncbi:MAG: HAMP domain-containing histidine kinase [Polyangiaceae bacterium]|nr:HAMP domain-containing histidine kinase [Polyangiaceae bacterium]
MTTSLPQAGRALPEIVAVAVKDPTQHAVLLRTADAIADPKWSTLRLARWLTIASTLPAGTIAVVHGHLTGTLSAWLIAEATVIFVGCPLILLLRHAPWKVQASVICVTSTAIGWLSFHHYGPLLGVGLIIAVSCALWTVFFGRNGMAGGVCATLAFFAVTAWASMNGIVDISTRSPVVPQTPGTWFRMWFTMAGTLVFLNGVANAVLTRYRAAVERVERQRRQLAVLLEREETSRRAAEEATKLRDEFIALAAHELRTPLTSLKLLVQMLRAKKLEGDLPAAKLEGQVSRLERLTCFMLDAARLAAGQRPLSSERVDMAEVARATIATFADALARSGSALELDAPKPVEGVWDREAVAEIVASLLDNAVKFGNGAPIDVTVRKVGDTATLIVRDRGIGIAEAERRRIFDRFYREVSWREYGGLGLGLYVAHRFVELHAGTIRVESEPGAGSTFTVELPLRPTSCVMSST